MKAITVAHVIVDAKSNDSFFCSSNFGPTLCLSAARIFVKIVRDSFSQSYRCLIGPDLICKLISVYLHRKQLFAAFFK